jgi:two-component system cell cycle response regulator
MRVLIADDDDVMRHILEASLTRWGYETVVARNGLEAWHILQANDAPRLAILDWIMPGMDGLEVCREIRKAEDTPYIYLLLLTAKHKREDVIAGMDAGADDYISKPFDPQELKVRLRAGRRILDLQAELVAARESLRYQATHDGLTGLLNRSAVLDTLRNELERANRQSIPLCLMLADFDHFKAINDTYGHTIGDAVLCEAARRMRASVRTYDCVGRYGGEEFIFILPGCDAHDARNQADRLKDCITGAPIVLPRITMSFTISIGIAVKSNAATHDLDTLIHLADSALYQAKTNGRDRAVLCESVEPVLKPAANVSLLELRAR